MIDQLVEKCSENIDENEMIYNRTLNDYKSSSCALYIVLFVVFLLTNILIKSVFIYFYWYLKKLQIFTTNIMKTIKGINIENRPYFLK